MRNAGVPPAGEAASRRPGSEDAPQPAGADAGVPLIAAVNARDLYADDPPTLEAAAERAVEFFRRELVDEHGQPACALVRFFKTHPYRDLPEDLQAVVRAGSPEAASIPDLRCLTLVATRGDEEDWNSRLTSRGHRAIPLMSVEMVQQAPMIAQLITQLGLPIANVVRPSRALLLDHEQTTHNVFFVPRALGSPHIVAQEEFVVRYGIQSVLGFGGLLGPAISAN